MAKVATRPDRKPDKMIEYPGGHTIEYFDLEHMYWWKNKDLPIDGVTSILKLLNKPALMPWAANMAAHSYEKDIRDWMESQTIADDNDERFPSQYLIDCLPGMTTRAKGAYRERSKEGTDVGSIAHNYLERRLKGESNIRVEDPRAEKACMAVENFLEQHSINVKPENVESVCFSEDYYYAGQPDILGSVDYISGVYDAKASNPFPKGEPYLEYKLQLAAYAVAKEEEFRKTHERDYSIDHGGILRLDKKSGLPYLHMVSLTKELKECWIRLRGLEQAIAKVQNG